MFEILVATLIVKDNKVLMVKEKKEEVKGLLNLPAGHLESNESLIEGAMREVLEETGKKIKITQLLETKHFSQKGKDYVAFVFQGAEIEYNTENELEYEYYDIEYLKENPTILRNEKLILSAINKMNSGSTDAIKYL